MSRPTRLLDRFTFGDRVPGAVGLLILVTVVTSLVGAFGSRHGAGLFELAALAPAKVWRGEVWRLVTWAFVETSPIGLLFSCLLLYWFGRDLVEVWGSARFVRVYLTLAITAAVGACLVARVDGDVMRASYRGSWPLAAALTVAWGLYHPDRQIRLFLILPIRGYVLAWLTVAMVVAYAIYEGWKSHVPSLVAIGAMLGWLFRRAVTARWAAHARARREARERAARERADGERRAAGEATARQIDALEAVDEDDPPPMPPEVEGVLDRILDEVRTEQRAKRARSGLD
jgi:membrane associated rhomboid family serine protease